MSDMTQSEAILEYIDGTLGHDAEQHLFESMARQPDLRSTLRQFISIGQAVHADREAYAPPAYVEHALLSGLGIPPIASSMASAAAGAGLMARMGLSGWRIWGMVASFILGALLAGGTVYMANGTSQATVIAGAAGPASTNGTGTIAGTAGNGNSAQNGGMDRNGNSAQNGTIASTAGNGNSAVNGNPAQNGNSGTNGNSAQNGNSATNANPAQSGTGASAAGTPLMAQGGTIGSGTGNASGVAIGRSPAARNTVSRSTIARNDAGGNSTRFHSGTTATSSRSGSNGASGANGNGASRTASTPRSSDGNGGSVTTSSNGASASNSGGVHNNPADITNAPLEGSASAPKIALITSTAPRSVPMTISAAPATSLSRAPEPLPASSLSPLDAGDGDPARVIGELRGMAGTSLNKTNALNSGSGLARAIQYFGVGAYWQLGAHFALGAEGGLEAYDQVLHYSNGDTAKVEQRPSYAWGGLAARYYFGTITAIGLEPFAQGTIGATSAGPLGRLRLGARHD
ncbi:MAG: hypothetical protein ABI876_09475, partial [Bacteroidota bacterium]